MAIRRSDIRLVDGDIAAVVQVLYEFLPISNFTIDEKNISSKFAYIKSSNNQYSFIKLFLSNNPQIVHWHIEQKNKKQTQIEVTGDLFKKFRIFYYIFLISLLSGFDFFLISAFTYNSTDKTLAFYDSAKLGFIGISFLLLAGFYIFKSLNFSSNFSIFKDNFYSILSTRGFKNEIIIKDNSIFPELWATVFLFGVSLAIELLFCIKDIVFNSSLFFYGLFILIIVLIILLMVLIRRPTISPRMIFLLVGFELCIFFAVYMNGPVFFIDETYYFLNDAEYLKTELANPSLEAINNLHQANMTSITVKSNVDNIVIIATLILSFVAFFSTILILSSTIRLPLKVLRYLNKFELRHQDSYYHKALDPEKSSNIFNIMVFMLWQLLAIANIFGLFLSLSIFEKTLLGTNLLFKSTLVDHFFIKTRFISEVISSFTGYTNDYILFHEIIMLLYSLPAVMFLILVLRKYLKSTLDDFFLLKNQSGTHEKIVEQLTEKIKEIGEYANVRIPIIKVVDNPNITAETRYLGFPFLKNILIISKGAWDELHNIGTELDALLAHEIWHIKKHTLTRKVLCFLSDYTLFGNGFLALFQNSFRVEQEADNFSIKWLIIKYQNKNNALHSMRSLLERIDEINWRNTLFQSNNSLNFSVLKNPTHRNDILKKYDNATITGKLKINLKLLYDMYFGDVILSYFHPSTNQRISWIEEKYGTNETN